MTPPSPTGRAPKVLCVGLSCLDLVWRVQRFPPIGSRTETTAHHRHGGGPAATAAVAAARFGADVALWANHGEDDAGRSLRRELEAENVDVRGVRVPAGSRSFVSAVLVAPDGERWIFPYRGEGLSDDPAAWPLDEVSRADVVLCDLRYPDLSRAVLEAARRAGVPSLVDLGAFRDIGLADGADVVIASREAAEEALPAATDGNGDVGERAEEALERLRSRPDQTIAVTLGEEGVIYDGGEGLRHLSALPVDDVVDTTGAGDVFHGVWAASLAFGSDVDACARHASVAAALSCRAPGRQAIPRGDEVRMLLEQRTAREMNEMQWA